MKFLYTKFELEILLFLVLHFIHQHDFYFGEGTSGDIYNKKTNVVYLESPNFLFDNLKSIQSTPEDIV